MVRGANRWIPASARLARASLCLQSMRQSLRGCSLIAALGLMSFACGGATFTSDNDAGTSSGGGSGGSSGGGSGGSGGSSGSGSGSGGSGGGSGGTSSSSGGGSGSSGGTGSSSGGCNGGDCADSGPGPACPSQVPSAKMSCSPQGLECEYGSNPVQGCDEVSTCEGTWATQVPTDSKCAVGVGPGCPLTFEAVPQGSSCSDNGLVCNYPRGRCACASSLGGPIMFVDGAVPAHWACQDPATAGCPTPRAPLGSACTQNGLSCDYGSCSVPGGTTQECEDNRWTALLTPCAAAQ
jgi:hypothetical protein